MNLPDKIKRCQEHGHGVLTPWEMGFCDSIARWQAARGSLSAKQQKVFDKIWRKMEGWQHGKA